ncbi:MAG: hypothetical protein LBK62_03395 [Treponema sp.]|jgi:hypothetical protein|nr:hypothetical protein [Treponema sp.]
MDLLKCTVCDADGEISGQEGKSIPVRTTVNKITTINNYAFYALPAGEQDKSKTKQVQVTMPVGGDMGLFRFPRVGESVLIGQIGTASASNQTTDWVLLSYFIQNAGSNSPFYPADAKQTLANENQLSQTGGFLADHLNPATMQEFLNDNGMAIRYLAEENKNKASETRSVNGENQPIGTVNAGEWSEIGFYNKKAKWPSSPKTFDETDKGNSLDPSRFDRQDVLNIQSAGDIESRAENYHLIKAKRFELLAKVEDELSPELRAHNDRQNWIHWQAGQAPLGDHPSDDPAVRGGDVHIRAGRSVVIKADKEIRLQVGRTVVVINDDGFTVTSRKLNQNAPLSQDTTLSLKARGGIDMFGENVNLSSSRKFSIADAWGGSLASMVGMVNLSGRQINQTTYGEMQQNIAAAMNTLTYVQDVDVGAIANNHPEDVYAIGAINYAFDVIRVVANTANTFYQLKTSYNGLAKHQQDLADKRNEAIQRYGTTLTENERNTLFPATRDVPITGAGDALGVAAMLIGAEPIEVAMNVLNMVLEMTNMVYAAVQTSYAKKWRDDSRSSLSDPAYKAQYNAAGKRAFADTLNLVAMDVDNGIIETISGVAGSAGIGAGGPAAIRLRQSGDIIIKAGAQKHLYAEASEKASVPAAIGPEKVQWGIKAAAALAKMGTDIGKLAQKGMDLTQSIPSSVESL